MIVDRFERKKEVAVGLLGAACACAELDVICPPPTWLRTTMACCGVLASFVVDNDNNSWLTPGFNLYKTYIAIYTL